MNEDDVTRSEVHDFVGRCLDSGWTLEELADELEQVEELRREEEG